jgi:hypothetical protein
MSSLADDHPELVGFFSYSREDDEDSSGALSELRDRIQRELRSQLGRSRATFRLWQDKEAIAPGKLWEAEIKAAVEQSVFFIPIVTPTAVKSGYCQHEFEAFLAREHALGRADLVFPIYYIRVPALEREKDWRADPVLRIVGTRQWADWRDLRLLDVNDIRVREAIARFCAKIADALQGHHVSPEERRRQADEAERLANEAAARAEAERQRLAIETKLRADAEERRKREAAEARDRADAARREQEAEARRRKAEDRKEPEQPPSSYPRPSLDPERGTLLDAIWPATPKNRIGRSLAVMALGTAALAFGFFSVTFALIWLNYLTVIVPAISLLYVALAGATLWPQSRRPRASDYFACAGIAAVVGLVVFISLAKLPAFLRHPLDMLPVNGIFFFALLAAAGVRLAIPLVLLAALASVGFPYVIFGELPVVSGLRYGIGIIAHGTILTVLLAKGWGWPPLRLIAAALLANLTYSIWLLYFDSMYSSGEALLGMLSMSVIGAAGVAALVKLGWQFAANRAQSAP